MSVVAPFAPGVELYKQFATSVTTQTPRLAAYTFGPAAYAVRYSEASERAAGAIGQWDDDTSLIGGLPKKVFAWPMKPTGSLLDAGFTKLFIERGHFRYHQSAVNAFATVAGRPNHVRNATAILATGNGYTATAAFGTGGVRVGDRVLIEGLDSATDPVSFLSYVVDFVGEPGSAAINATIVGDANVDTQLAAAVLDDTNRLPAEIELDTAFGTAYDGRTSGRMEETYRVIVTVASDGDDLTAARVSVLSGSGTDDHYNVAVPAFGTTVAVGTRGLVVGFDNTLSASPHTLAVGDYWDYTLRMAYTAPTITSAGTYVATDERDRSYIAQVLQGGALASTVIRITEANGYDAPQTITLVESSGDAEVSDPISVGSYGITATFDAATGLVYGDRWVIPATAAKPQQLRTAVLAHTLPDVDMSTAQVSFLVPYTGEVPARSHIPGEYNYTASDDELVVAADIQIAIPGRTFVTSEIPLIYNSVFGSTANRLFATFRAWMPRSTGLLSITSPADLDDAVVGPVHPDNPLKYALSKALLASNGVPVYFFNVGDPAVTSNWIQALDVADNTPLTYGLVPLTTNTTILDLVAGHVTTRSGPLFNLYRRGWFTADVVDVGPVADASATDDGLTISATITDNPLQSGTQYTLLSLTSGNFQLNEAGIRSGDRVRISYASDAWGDETYDEYTIDVILTENTARLVSGPDMAESVPKRIEIWRTLTTEEKAQAYASRLSDQFTPEYGVAQTADGRYPGYAYCFLPFGTVYDGTWEVPAYYMAAFLAAARGALAPHQPMTRLPVAGFSGVKDVNLFSSTQLNEITAAGGFIVAPEVMTGQLLVRHAVTAGDWNDVNQREESVISNVDSINFALVRTAKPYVGKANITDQSLAMLRADIEALKSRLYTASYGPLIGPQLLDMTLRQLRQSVTAKDSVIIDLDMLVPGPMNRVRINVLVQ